MYHVVLAVDEEEPQARTAAKEIAKLPGAGAEMRVDVLHCFTDNPSGASATQVAAVRTAVDILENHGIDYEVVEASGDPAEAIVHLADSEDADLVVVGGRKRSPAGKALFGSVTQTVILSAGCSVMVTGVAQQ